MKVFRSSHFACRLQCTKQKEKFVGQTLLCLIVPEQINEATHLNFLILPRILMTIPVTVGNW